MSQGMQVPSRLWKTQGNRFLPVTFGRNTCLSAPWFWSSKMHFRFLTPKTIIEYIFTTFVVLSHRVCDSLAAVENWKWKYSEQLHLCLCHFGNGGTDENCTDNCILMPCNNGDLKCKHIKLVYVVKGSFFKMLFVGKHVTTILFVNPQGVAVVNVSICNVRCCFWDCFFVCLL